MRELQRMAAMTYALTEPDMFDEFARPLRPEYPSSNPYNPYNPYKPNKHGKGKDRSKVKAARKQNRKNK